MRERERERDESINGGRKEPVVATDGVCVAVRGWNAVGGSGASAVQSSLAWYGTVMGTVRSKVERMGCWAQAGVQVQVSFLSVGTARDRVDGAWEAMGTMGTTGA